MDDSRFLSTSEVAAGLEGEAPEPFVVGHRLELVLDTGRLVRGEVVASGVVSAQLVPYWSDPWQDDKGVWHPATPRILVVAYGQVIRWAEPSSDVENGNWTPQHPDYDAEMSRSSGDDWHDWPRL